MSDAGSSRHLTEAEVEKVRQAPPGQAPSELARHLASCDTCQERVLFAGQTREARPGRPRPEWPSPTRALLLLVLMVVAMAGFFFTLRLLVGR